MTIRLHRNDLPDDWTYGEAVAIDTETLGLEIGRDRLCVVQLSRGDGDAEIVKIEAGQTRAPNIERMLADPSTTKLFHFGRFDLATLCAAFGVMGSPVYCTKIASKLARTYTDRHGLKDLTPGTARRRDFEAAAILRLGRGNSQRGAACLCRLGCPLPARAARKARRHADARGAGCVRPGGVRLSAGARSAGSGRVRRDGRLLARLSVKPPRRCRDAPARAPQTSAFCMATSRSTPERARPSMRISSASLNGAPSAEPWTSTRPPEPVSTKLASVSAFESSA